MCNMLLRMIMQSALSMHVICISSYFILCMCLLVLASNQQLDCVYLRLSFSFTSSIIILILVHMWL